MTADISDIREPSFSFLDGLGEISEQYDYFIFDVYGVVHDGIRLFPGTIDVFERLKAAGKQVCLLSNSPRRAEGLADNLAHEKGLARDLYDHIVTPGEMVYQALQEPREAPYDTYGHDCWLIANDFDYISMDGLNIRPHNRPDDAGFILNTISGANLSGDLILRKQLQLAAERGLPMICSNPDLVVMIGDEELECAGTLAALYERMGGRVVYHGKPHAPVYERCLELFGEPDTARVLAIGDAMRTDIAGANGMGIDAVFNLVGIHWGDVQADHEPGAADLEKIRRVVDTHPHHPQFTMAGLRW